MSEPIRIELDFLPPPVLRGNGRTRTPGYRTAEKNKMIQSGIAHGIIAMRDEGVEPITGKAAIKYTFYTPNATISDDDNFAIGMKSFRDGLVQSGLFADDSSKYLATLPSEFVTCKRGESRTVIEIEVLE